jgi:hypothetical protein
MKWARVFKYKQVKSLFLPIFFRKVERFLERLSVAGSLMDTIRQYEQMQILNFQNFKLFTCIQRKISGF